MKKINYSPSDSDIKAILCTLEVMPSYGFYETEAEANAAYTLSASAGEKLIMRQQLSNRESAFVALALDNAFKALRDEITVDPDAVASLRPYFFTINKLHPVFAPLLNESF